MRLETRLAHRGDLDEASRVLGEAFADYPWTRWTVDDCDHVDRIAALQRLALEHYGLVFGLVFGQVWIAFVDDVQSSVAVWMDSSVTIPGHTLGFVVIGHHRITGGGPDVWAVQRQPDSLASVRSPDLH